MRSPLKKCAIRASVLCLGLVFSAAFAQEGETETGPIPSVEQAADTPADDGAQLSEESEAVPTPVAESAPEPEEKVKPTRQAPEKRTVQRSSGGGDIELRYGFRTAAGISGFAGHKPLTNHYSQGWVTDNGFRVALKPGPLVSGSAGVAVDVDLSGVVDLGIPYAIGTGLQYTFYSAYASLIDGRAATYSRETGIQRAGYEVGVQLHALELPVLVRFGYGDLYFEVGPQLGVHLFQRENAKGGLGGDELDFPQLNPVSFGPAVGLGADLDGILVGVRFYIDAVVSGKGTGGYPWTFQAGVTAYPF
jgi:hypothetical protein